MPIGRRAKDKSSKKRDAVSQQVKSGSAKNLSAKGTSAIIHQVKNTSRKAYSPKTKSKKGIKAG